MLLGTRWAQRPTPIRLGTQGQKKNPVSDGESLAHPVGLEPTTDRLEGGCSIQLS